MERNVVSMPEYIIAFRNLHSALQALPALAAKDPRNIAAIVKASGILDSAYYLNKNADVARAGMDPYLHFATHGFMEGRAPARELETSRRPIGEIDFATFAAKLLHSLEIEAVQGAKKTASPKRAIKILRQGSYHTHYDMPLYVSWVLTNMCNYNCSYCFGHDKLDKKKSTNMRQLAIAVENIASLRRPFYEITLSGGEPTAHPDFDNLIYLLAIQLNKKLSKLHIVSNGSRDMNFFSGLKEIAERVPVSYNVSIHTEHADPDHIEEIITQLSSHMYISFNLMFHPDKRILLEKIVDKLLELRRKYFFDFWFSMLREPPNFDRLDSRYKQEHKDWKIAQEKKMAAAAPSFCKRDSFAWRMFEPDIFWDVIKDGSHMHYGARNSIERWSGGNDFKGMHCIAGAHSLRISPTGYANGIVCPEDKHYVNMFRPEAFKNCDFMSIIKCNMEHCGCSANYPMMKFIDKDEAEAFLLKIKNKQEQLWTHYRS